MRNRQPFSTAAAAPTDLVLPISTLADADRLTVLGRGTVLGRPAVRVEVPFERAEPLFPFLSIGGDWRPFFPNDRVRIWPRRAQLVPVALERLPGDGRRARRLGAAVRPARRALAAFGLLGAGAPREPRHAGRERVRHPRDDVGAGSGRSRGRAERRASARPGSSRWRRARSAGSTATAWSCRGTTPARRSSRTRTGSRSSTWARRVRGTATRRSARSACRPRRSRSPGAASRTTSRPRGTTAVASRSTRPGPTCTSSPTCRARELLAAAGGAPGAGSPDARRVDAPPGRRGDRRTRLARDRSGVRPVPDRAPERAARRVRARERGAGGRRVRCRGDAVPEGRGRRRRHRHDPAAPRGRERAAAGDVGRPVERWTSAACRGGSPPTVRSSNGSTAACTDRSTRRGSRSRSSSPSRPRSAGTGQTDEPPDEPPPYRRDRGGRRDGLRARRHAHARDPGWANLPDPGSSAEPPAVPATEPQPPEAFLVWTSGGMPDGFRAAVGRLDGIQRSVVIASDNTWLGPIVVGAGRGGRRPEARVRDPARGRGGRSRGVRAVPAARRPVRRARARRRPRDPGESSARLRGLGPGRC